MAVARPENQETTALGAALAAGLAVGLWTESQIFGEGSTKVAEFSPQVTPEAAEARYKKWQKAVRRSMDLADLADQE